MLAIFVHVATAFDNVFGRSGFNNMGHMVVSAVEGLFGLVILVHE
jgi:hypothetical protein